MDAMSGREIGDLTFQRSWRRFLYPEQVRRKALGVKISDNLLTLADEVIE
jgi:hypothetical protein